MPTQQVYPFFYQYDVRPAEADGCDGMQARGVLATIMVFAENDAVGRARAGQYIAGKHFRIVAVKRAMLIGPQHLGTMEGVLKTLYTRAELQGISGCFDSWSTDGRPQTSW